jgi:hypothetical protein
MCQLPCGADFNAKLSDPYLQREFQWAMYIEASEINPYLYYPGSNINAMTQFRVSSRAYPQASNFTSSDNQAQVYEEFWYRLRTPIGLRRHSQLSMSPNQIGAIVMGTSGDNVDAATNILVRLLVDLDLQRLVPSVVMIPLDKYDKVGAELARYSFVTNVIPLQGAQFSIHLRSYPMGKDNYFYLQH